MTSWLAKFRISAALDKGKPFPPALQRQIARSDELRQFAENAAALEGALRRPPLENDLSPQLHAAIMRAVRSAGQPGPAQRAPAFWRWLPAPALAVLVLAGWWLLRPPPTPSPWSPAAAVLQEGQQMAQTAPSVLVAPLAQEWQRLNRDLDNTAQFLLASLP